MPAPVTFQRLYRLEAGIEHPATERRVEAVLRSMVEHQDGEAPFKVLIRMDDGSSTTFAPKRWRR
jgi:hypothetical protein